MRIIKKYPNRRLYDTQTSAYITLSEVKGLVMEREPFVVQDAKTGDNLTRSILLQIILEEEAAGAPMFSEAALANIIRFYGHTMQSVMGAHIERNIQLFSDFQAKMADAARDMTPEAWAQAARGQSPAASTWMTNYVNQSQSLLKQMQDQFEQQSAQVLGALGVKRP